MKSLSVLTLTLFCFPAFAGTVAVTEFMNDPLVDDTTDEWIELYNYGDLPVDLTGWTLDDEDSDHKDIPSVVLDAGQFIVLAEDAAGFVAAWGVGTVDVDVLQADLGSLANTGDEIILHDSVGQQVWSLAYPDGEVAGEATYLVNTDFTVTSHGDKAAPGVNRRGTDNGDAYYQGYDNTLTSDYPDAMAWTNADGDTGSPLSGHYGAAAPSIDLVLGGACPGVVDISVHGLAGSSYAFVTGTAPGPFTVPAGTCTGTELDVGGSAALRLVQTADAYGDITLSPDLGAGACGSHLQVMDTATCELSEAVILP